MITFKDYPYYTAENTEDVKETLRIITNTRKDDITQINNLVNTFISGRKVEKVPSSSADVDAEKDRVGDFNYDTSYIYILVDNAGTAVWRRATLASW